MAYTDEDFDCQFLMISYAAEANEIVRSLAMSGEWPELDRGAARLPNNWSSLSEDKQADHVLDCVHHCVAAGIAAALDLSGRIDEVLSEPDPKIRELRVSAADAVLAFPIDLPPIRAGLSAKDVTRIEKARAALRTKFAA